MADIDTSDNILHSLLQETIVEKRRARRWKIFFRLAYLLLALVAGFVFLFDSDARIDTPHTAIVDLEGIIASGAPANAYDVISGLEDAFEAPAAKGIILRINSPGGSPVQSDLINREINRLRALHPQKRIFSVVEDLCASGGYYVAVATEKIFVSPSSVVGSIGVRMDGFEFTDAIKKLGIERRLLTAGENKGFLDPFSPLKTEQKEHVQAILDDIHSQFIDTVRAGRGDRLQEREDTFSGLIWTGTQGIELGLVDEVGSVLSVSRDVIGEEVLVNYSVKESFGERLVRRFGAEIATKVMTYQFFR
jgi:protease-4